VFKLFNIYYILTNLFIFGFYCRAYFLLLQTLLLKHIKILC